MKYIRKIHPGKVKKSKEYSDKVKKNAAYDLLVEKLEGMGANGTKELVTKKINNMRSSFRKECNKVWSSMKSGSVRISEYNKFLLNLLS